jgi:hypothetical protein
MRNNLQLRVLEGRQSKHISMMAKQYIIPENFRESVKVIIAVVCSYGPDPVRQHGMSGRSKAAAYL